MNRIAIIDCGTNTFHLMIVKIDDQSFSIQKRIKTAVRIGAGGINNNQILEAGQERALTALTDFKKIIISENIEQVYAFATSAFRNAQNGTVFRDTIQQLTGIDIQVIDGNREAELIFKGVNYALKLGKDIALVMDIGGGSVEFIIGNGSTIFWKKSFEIGGQRLVELFHNSDPIQRDEIQNIEQYLDKTLSELLIALNKYHPKILAGSAGTFDTLSEIYCAENNIEIKETDPELPLTLEAFSKIHEQLISKTKDERLQIPGMIEMRVDMIVVASCLINYLISKYKFEEVRVSTYSLKEGFLTEHIN